MHRCFERADDERLVLRFSFVRWCQKQRWLIGCVCVLAGTPIRKWTARRVAGGPPTKPAKPTATPTTSAWFLRWPRTLRVNRGSVCQLIHFFVIRVHYHSCWIIQNTGMCILLMLSCQRTSPQQGTRTPKRAATFGKRSNSMRRNPNAEVTRQGWLHKQVLLLTRKPQNHHHHHTQTNSHLYTAWRHNSLICTYNICWTVLMTSGHINVVATPFCHAGEQWSETVEQALVCAHR